MAKTKNIRQFYKKKFVRIKVDENDYFQHPISGLWYSDIEQALQGFSEQDNDLNTAWDLLKINLSNETHLIERDISFFFDTEKTAREKLASYGLNI